MIDTFRAGFDSSVPLLQRCARQYGDPFRVVTRNGPITTTGKPEAIRAIYTAPPDTFGPMGVEITEPIFGRAGVTVTSGARHRRDRKLLASSFNASAIKGYAPLIAEICERATRSWRPGLTFSMLDITQSIALDIIVRLVFGVEEQARARLVRGRVIALIEALNPLVIVFPALRHDFFGLGPWARLCRAKDALNATLLEEIRERRRATEPKTDILSLLLAARYDDGSAMPDLEIIEQLRTLLFAGHETTAMSIAWGFYHLHQKPAELGRVLEEIGALGPHPDPNALGSLPYLDAVCQEILRLCPPVVDVGRVPREPFELAGYTIPAGEGIVPSPLLLHANEELYPEPEQFRPSRFLERTYSPFEYIPFGGGGRRCLGAAFAMIEMKVVLGTLLSAYRLKLANGEPTRHVRRGITMGPKGKVPMVVLGKGSLAVRDLRLERAAFV